MSKSIPEEHVDRVKSVAKVEDLIPGLKKAGAGLIAKCPFCGKEGKGTGISISPAKQIWKCFSSSCDKGGTGAISYVMESESLDFPDAIRYLADHYNLILEDPKPEPTKKKPIAKKDTSKKSGDIVKRKSFCEEQLESSGLTVQDITVDVSQDKSTTVELPVFRKGTKTQYGDITPGEGDDMLIYYYDLEGRPIMFKKNEKKTAEQLIRVRWQNPERHVSKDGKPMKYQSPAGSGTHIYIPEKIRKMYRNARKIKTLFIQEGEKKAEKACKHNINSIGIMGIQNLGSKNKFPEELQYIIQQCEVEDIIFLLDSDWRDLSSNLQNGDRADGRPRSFFYAVKNYKDYIRSLFNLGISLEIYFGYLKKNDKQEKGVDDFLHGTLNGKEKNLVKDIEKAMHDKEGIGDYVEVHKITMMNDVKIADMWFLNDSKKFGVFHNDEIKHLQQFYFRKLKRRFNEKGEMELDQPILPDEQYWEEEEIKTTSGIKKQMHFHYTKCFNFLQNRGFWRFRMKSGEFRFISIDNQVVEIVDNYHIKDFVTGFTRELKEDEKILELLYRGGPQYLGFEKLSNLDYKKPTFERAGKANQCLFFHKKIWEISDAGVNEYDYNKLQNHVWKDKIIDFNAEITEPLLEAYPVTKDNINQLPGFKIGDVSLNITDTGNKCHFLKFLLNTSNFYWKKKKKGEEITDQEVAIVNKHLLNKLTSIGYLLHEYKNDSEMKAIIAMDGMLSEVGASEGRTGKSIIGVAIEQVIPQVYIAAKSRKLTEDNFLFGEVTEKTKNVFLDDVRANIDFEFFFPLITGKLKVNPKGGQPFTLDKADTPKLLISTNHAINGDGSSFDDRQAFIAFSDFYNDKHKPVDDFGRNFFSEWEGSDQWNLFYNLMANCLQLYFRSISEGWSGRGQGIVRPPMESLNKRRLRQQMGEDFLAWADEFFSGTHVMVDMGVPDVPRIGSQLPRKEMFDDLLERNIHLRKYVNASGFLRRLKSYCYYYNLHLNPNKKNKEGIDIIDFLKDNPGKCFIGESDKRHGKEYLTVSRNEDVMQ